jgi:hypothetical protein
MALGAAIGFSDQNGPPRDWIHARYTDLLYHYFIGSVMGEARMGGRQREVGAATFPDRPVSQVALLSRGHLKYSDDERLGSG